jgi:hypothetical protein
MSHGSKLFRREFSNSYTGPTSKGAAKQTITLANGTEIKITESTVEVTTQTGCLRVQPGVSDRQIKISKT